MAHRSQTVPALKKARRNRSRLDGEKGKGESAARQTPASSHTFRCGQYLRPLRKATGFDRDIYGYEPPGIAGGGLLSAFASSAEKLTAEEIGPLTGRGASEAGIRCTASGDACRQWTLMKLSPARWLQPLRPSACRSIFSTTMSWISPREAAYSSTFQGTLV